MKYKYVFIIVTYKNAEDLFDFDNSLRELGDSYKVIVVDSFYSVKTQKRIKTIADKLEYDYVPIENRGYGYGNNIGIKLALKKYSFNYAIICNSDVIIKKFNDTKLKKENYVFGPNIKTITNKRQNPYWVNNNRLAKYAMYIGKKNRSKILIYISIMINKIERESFLLFNKNKIKKVCALHGSFIGFSKDVLEKINPLYDEKMFLYNEEALISTKLKNNKITSEYYPLIQVFHKEDGSTGGKPNNISEIANQSYIYYYENYCKRKQK